MTELNTLPDFFNELTEGMHLMNITNGDETVTVLVAREPEERLMLRYFFEDYIGSFESELDHYEQLRKL